MSSRIVVLLHPNTKYIEFIMNDRMFNKEEYQFSRKAEAMGPEKTLLRVLNSCTNGVVKAEPGRNAMRVEIQDGFFLYEVVPEILIAIKEFVGEKDYNPEIFVDDRRYIVEPEYAESDWEIGCQISPGVKAKPGEVDIGVLYTVWSR